MIRYIFLSLSLLLAMSSVLASGQTDKEKIQIKKSSELQKLKQVDGKIQKHGDQEHTTSTLSGSTVAKPKPVPPTTGCEEGLDPDCDDDDDDEDRDVDTDSPTTDQTEVQSPSK